MPQRQEFHIDYFDKPYGRGVVQNTDVPTFRLTQNYFDGVELISTPKNFQSLALDILNHLKKPESLQCTYRVLVYGPALKQIGETGESALEEIIALHNDLVTPKRTPGKVENQQKTTA